jgi:prepilin-type N-terminal cleavage/methylation domain-containing protein
MSGMEKKMKGQSIFNKRGITLIELLVALVISAITMAAIYKVFISQTKVYYVQDQVVEVQQNVRTAMEVLLRDLRMTGFDDNNPDSAVTITNPISAFSDNSITVNYEYYDRTSATYQKYTVAYWRDGNSRLMRQLTINDAGPTTEPVLDNVDALTFTYGVDDNDDNAVDSWVAAGSVGVRKVIAVRVVLTARPDQTNPDVQKIVSPRTLNTIVTMRNLCL